MRHADRSVLPYPSVLATLLFGLTLGLGAAAWGQSGTLQPPPGMAPQSRSDAPMTPPSAAPRQPVYPSARPPAVAPPSKPTAAPPTAPSVKPPAKPRETPVALPLPLPPPPPPPPPPDKEAEAPAPAPAGDESKTAGDAPKLPRFAALKSDTVNLRAGPGTRYPIQWVYNRRDLPVEIEREFEVWRAIRDPEGVRGWVHSATLTGRRTFVVKGVDATVRSDRKDNASAVVILRAGVIGRLRACEAGSTWCEVRISGHRGYLRRDQIWGLLPDEVVKP